MVIRIYLPWNNLGCLGIKVGNFYMDTYRSSVYRLGLFVNTGKTRGWLGWDGWRPYMKWDV